MKKLYFALLLISPYFLFAQSTITLQDSEDNISGGSYELTTSSSDAVDVPFEIKNTGASDANWRITRLKMDVPGGWSDLMCWGHATDPFGGTCFSSSQMAGNPWTTPNGTSFTVGPNEYGKLKITISPEDGASGLGHYRYYVSNDGVNYIDSVDIKFDYSLSVQEVEPISVSIVPNPASDFIQVNLAGVSTAQMKMVDVLGSEVLNQSVSTSSTFDISNFRNGVYIMSFSAPGSKSIVRKVIVKH
ncbi:MAG: T9SS type A sorting domain-containing protein [Crocinitomicaceae bacterium]|nr:T9SS type A sorting domain-containing protein [Crocinitomicaceae bacterium]